VTGGLQPQLGLAFASLLTHFRLIQGHDGSGCPFSLPLSLDCHQNVKPDDDIFFLFALSSPLSLMVAPLIDQWLHSRVPSFRCRQSRLAHGIFSSFSVSFCLAMPVSASHQLHPTRFSDTLSDAVSFSPLNVAVSRGRGVSFAGLKN